MAVQVQLSLNICSFQLFCFWPLNCLYGHLTFFYQLKRGKRNKIRKIKYQKIFFKCNGTFLTKIQNRINKNSGKEILLLSKFLVMWPKTWMVVGFTIQIFFDSCVFTRFLEFHQWILNFCQECYYRKIYEWEQ